MMPPVTLSRLVVSKAMRTVPYPVRSLLVAGLCKKPNNPKILKTLNPHVAGVCADHRPSAACVEC